MQTAAQDKGIGVGAGVRREVIVALEFDEAVGRGEGREAGDGVGNDAGEIL